MYKALEQCIGELRVNHTDKEITGVSSECFQIIKNVSYDYTDNTTVKDIWEDHPELAFMDDEEIEEILEQAKTMRHKRGAAEEEYLTEGDMEELLGRNPDWLDLGTHDQGFWIRKMAESTPIEALASMVWVCTGSARITIDVIKQTMREYLKEKQAGIRDRREEIFQKILEETERRNRIEEEVLKLIAENKHGEAAGLLADLDDRIIKDLYQEYWDLREEDR